MAKYLIMNSTKEHYTDRVEGDLYLELLCIGSSHLDSASSESRCSSRDVILLQYNSCVIFSFLTTGNNTPYERDDKEKFYLHILKPNGNMSRPMFRITSCSMINSLWDIQQISFGKSDIFPICNIINSFTKHVILYNPLLLSFQLQYDYWVGVIMDV